MPEVRLLALWRARPFRRPLRRSCRPLM
jgi:hypothetical protein